MNNPKISVITISYNNISEIEDTIKSVVDQEYPNKEYLIIDGGSEDGTLDIINNYQNKIDYIISEKDQGISDAFNKGIKAATGDWIVMINAGDLLTDNALNKFARTYKPEYDVIKGNTIRWNPETEFKSIEHPVITYHTIPFNFLVCHQSTYISKKAYEKVGGYRIDMKVAMDLEMMLRLTKIGMKFYEINQELAIFRMGGISQTSKKRRIQEMKYAVELNGRTKIQVNIFILYVKIRTWIRNLLNRVNPDLKNKIITHELK